MVIHRIEACKRRQVPDSAFCPFCGNWGLNSVFRGFSIPNFLNKVIAFGINLGVGPSKRVYSGDKNAFFAQFHPLFWLFMKPEAQTN